MPVAVVRRGKPLEMITMDLTALPPQQVQGKKLVRKWILVAIDSFSRYGWIEVLSSIARVSAQPLPYLSTHTSP